MMQKYFFELSTYSPLCYFKSIELAAVLKSYYETAWENAIIIKDGPVVIDREVENIIKLKTIFDRHA